MSPIVSIIVPVYQVSDYVERCLESVMKQTYKNLECVIVDDATKDDSMVKCEKLIGVYNGPIRFIILHHETNRGLSAARNTGTDAATGDYLLYLDSDDEITPDCIEKLVSYVLDSNSIQMVQGNYLKIYKDKEETGKSDSVRIMGNDEARHQFLYWRKLNYMVCNKLLKKTFVIDNKLYNREGLINEDLLWTFYLVRYLSNAQLCKDVTYYYHIRPDSILTGGSPQKIGQSYVVIFDEILHHLTSGKESEELTGLLSTFCVELANYYRHVPELKPVVHLYKNLLIRYSCWPAYFTLSVVSFVSRFSNPLGILKQLNGLLWRMRRLVGKESENSRVLTQ